MSNKPGYKHTPLGWIPEEWEVIEFGKIVKSSQYGLSNSSANGGKHRIIGMKNIQGGKLLTENCATVSISDEEFNKYKLVPDDFLFNRTNSYDLVGKSVLIETDPDATFASYLIRFKLDKVKVVPKFVYYFFNTDKSDRKLKAIATKAVSQANINPTVLQNIFEVLIPPLPEQKKISNVLTIWDTAISKMDQLVVQLQDRNKGLTQQLLTGKKRLEGFSEPWKEIHLTDAFNERNETGYVNLNLLSVGSLGVYPQSQSDKRDTSNSDKAKYKRICPGDIGYNTMRMWQGRSALSALEGIVSPAYTIVTPKERQHPQFFAYLFKSPSVVNKFFRNSQGLVEDTLNCKFKDFALVKVEVPEYEEQVAIAKVISKAHTEVNLYEKKLAALKQQKKGLMQKLMTGEVRVKV